MRHWVYGFFAGMVFFAIADICALLSFEIFSKGEVTTYDLLVRFVLFWVGEVVFLLVFMPEYVKAKRGFVVKMVCILAPVLIGWLGAYFIAVALLWVGILISATLMGYDVLAVRARPRNNLVW